MYLDVFALCPGVSWPPLSIIVTLLLGWAGYCVCTSNARCDAFLYCLVLLTRIHSKLCELLSPLLFIDGSLYTNDVFLLFYNVLQERLSERVKQWIIRTHCFNVRLHERIRGVICAGDFNHVYVFEFGILNQTIWSLTQLVSSNSLRSSSSLRFGDRVLLLLDLRLFAFAECVKKVRPFGPIEHGVSLDWYVSSDFQLLLYCAEAIQRLQWFHSHEVQPVEHKVKDYDIIHDILREIKLQSESSSQTLFVNENG